MGTSDMGRVNLWRGVCLCALLCISVTTGLMTSLTHRLARRAAPPPAPLASLPQEHQIGTVMVTGSARSSRLPWQQHHHHHHRQDQDQVDNPSRHVGSPQPLQDGEKRFSFYLYGPNGLLEETTLSLHQVQAMLLECSPYRAMAGENTRASNEQDFVFSSSPHSPISRPSSNVEGVVATVQQMVAEETQPVAATSSSPSILKDAASGESLEIPEDILQNLHNVPEHIATQWQFLSTFSPPQSTISSTTSSFTTPHISTPAATSSGIEETGVTASVPEDIQEPTRSNNRLPARTPVSAEATDEGNEVTTQNLEPTEDYHSSPEAQSVDTVIPLVSTATIDFPVTSEGEESNATDNATIPNVMSSEEGEATDVEVVPEAKEDALLSTLTDFYAESFNNAGPPPSPSTVEEGEEEMKDYHTTAQPFHSTFINFATSVLSGDSPFASLPSIGIVTETEPSDLPETSTATTTPESSSYTPPDELLAADGNERLTASTLATLLESTVATETSGSVVTLPYETENLLSIDIVDPVESENPYDVMPLEGQGSKYPLRASSSGEKEDGVQSYNPSGEALDPYESPALLLQVLQSHNQLLNTTEKRPEEKGEGEDSVLSPDETQDSQHASSSLSLSSSNLSQIDTKAGGDEHLKELPTQPDTQDGTAEDDPEQYADTIVVKPPTYSAPSPAAAPSSVATQHEPPSGPARSPLLPTSAELSSTGGTSSVLPSSQLAPTGQQDKIDLEALEVNGNLTEGDTFYDYYGSTVYLDNVPEEYYNYYDLTVEQPQLNTTEHLGFPGPNATSPYHDHHHHDHHDGDHHHGDHHHGDHHHGDHHHHGSPPDPPATLLPAPKDNPGLEASVESLEADIRQFVDVMNDITFRAYKRAAAQHKRQNFVMSPLNLISTLGMLLLGTRGPSAGVLRELMQMDKFYTFNPHLVLKNVTTSMLGLRDVHDITFFSQFLVDMSKNPYSMEFFTKAIKVFYGAEIEAMAPPDFEAFMTEKVNEMVSKNTNNSTQNFLNQEEPLYLTPPLSTVATSFLHARWSLPVTQEDLVDMNFIRFPTAERRLIQTTGLRKKVTVNAGFSREAEATSAEVPLYSGSGLLSLVLVMPGEQKNFVANGLTRLETSLSSAKWSQLLRSMLPNTVNLKMPLFRHRAFHNFSGILRDLGLEQLFQKDEADFSGINHIKNLHLSDVVQLTEFQSCQIEDLRLTSSRAVNGLRKRRRRSPHIDSLTNEENNGSPHVIHHPTYIYGLPMVEYKRERITRMESGQRRGTGGGSNGKDVLKRTKASTQPFMSTRNIDGGIHEAETYDSATLSSTDGLLMREGSSSPEAVITPLGKPTNTLPHVASHSEADELKTSNEDNADEKRTTEKQEEEKLKGLLRKGHEDENYYYYNSYNYYNYEYGENTYDYDSENHEDNTAEGTTATITPDGGYEEKKEEEARETAQWENEEGVNRMGIAADGPGAHYRQSDVGTLAFDRAFLYAVRHNPTGLLLFLGRYLDPQAN